MKRPAHHVLPATLPGPISPPIGWLGMLTGLAGLVSGLVPGIVDVRAAALALVALGCGWVAGFGSLLLAASHSLASWGLALIGASVLRGIVLVSAAALLYLEWAPARGPFWASVLTGALAMLVTETALAVRMMRAHGSRTRPEVHV